MLRDEIDWNALKTKTIRKVEEEALGGRCLREYLLERGRLGYHRATIAAGLAITVNQLDDAVSVLRLEPRLVLVDATEAPHAMS